MSCKKPPAKGRVFYLDVEEEEEKEETENSIAIITGTLHVNHLCAHVLFDAGATCAFINPKFAKKLACKSKEMDVQLSVVAPLRSIYHTNVIF